jgi:hypothetical protein
MTDRFREVVGDLIRSATLHVAAFRTDNAVREGLVSHRDDIAWEALKLMDQWHVERQIETLMVKRRQRRNRKPTR